MNQKIAKIALLVVGAVLAIFIVYISTSKQATAPTVPSISDITTNQPVDSNPVQGPNNVYENEYMKVTIPYNWSYKAVAPGAVNISKNNYILFINPNAQQASGVEGGRFAEIAMGAPSSDAVIQSYPDTCGERELHSEGSQYSRSDYYIDSNITKTETWCASPSDGSTAWYFSYMNIGDEKGYFNYYTPGGSRAYVITMAYDSKDVNKLPKKGSAELSRMLSEMTNIVKTLELKNK